MDASEVARHNTKDSCWVVIHGTVWDVTDFLDDHPGGVKLILKHAGGDATEAYESIHNPDLITETLPPARCLGAVDPSSVAVKSSGEPKRPTSKYPSLGAMINVEDFEKVAEQYLTETGWAYYSSGAEDELSIQESRRVFRKLSLRPRILRDVDNVSTATNILGLPSSLPIYISPTGSAKFAHPEAEPLIVSAAGKEGIIYCMPTSPSASLEAIFGARVEKSQSLFFQLYVNRNKEKAKTTIKRAVDLGAKAIFITVDSPVIGKRERDERLTAGDDPFVASTAGVAKTGSAGLLNAGLTWKDLIWIRETTTLPLVIKGIQSVEDAVLAYQHGVDGIILSNHGGRSQDTAQTPMITLLEIRKYAPELLSRNRKKFQVFLDGGIRRGTDVIKALALGATAVGIGRPVLYSMTAGYGENGIRRLIQILRAELETNMAMIGAAKLEDLVPEMVNSERAEKGVSLRVKL